MSPNYKMIPGSKEVNTPGTFKNDAAVLNMGHPVNYGMADSPVTKHEPGHEEKKRKIGTEGMTLEEKLEYYEKQKKKSKGKKQSSVKMGIGTGFTSL